MKKKILNLLAVSMVVFLASSDLKAGSCPVDGNKVIKLVNDAGNDVHYSGRASDGRRFHDFDGVVSANHTGQIRYCQDGLFVTSLKVMASVGSGGFIEEFDSRLFDQLIGKKTKQSERITITVSPTTAGFMATAEIK